MYVVSRAMQYKKTCKLSKFLKDRIDIKNEELRGPMQ